jgi:hypothetical protein
LRVSAGSLGEKNDRLVLVVDRVSRLAVGASGAASLGAGTQRFVHDLLDGPGATAALGATAEASIDLTRGAREIPSAGHDITHVVVGQDVAGTNNHGMLAKPVRTLPNR